MTWKLENLPQIKIIDGQKNLGLEFFKDIKKSDKLKALSPTPFYGIGLQIQDFLPGAATRGVLWKKLLLEISQNSQENTCARACPATLLKKRAWRRCFPVNFVHLFYRIPLDNCFWFCDYRDSELLPIVNCLDFKRWVIYLSSALSLAWVMVMSVMFYFPKYISN